MTKRIIVFNEIQNRQILQLCRFRVCGPGCGGGGVVDGGGVQRVQGFHQ